MDALHAPKLTLIAIALWLAQARGATADEKPTFDDEVKLINGSIIKCRVESAADLKLTLLVDDGGSGSKLEVPTSALISIKTSERRAVQYINGPAVKPGEKTPLLKKGDKVAYDSAYLATAIDPLAASDKDGEITVGRQSVVTGNIVKLATPAKNAIDRKNDTVDLSDTTSKITTSLALSGLDGNKRGLTTTGEIKYSVRGARLNLIEPDSIPLWSIEAAGAYSYAFTTKPPPENDQSPITSHSGSMGLDYQNNHIHPPSFGTIFDSELNYLAYTKAEIGFDRVKHIRQYNFGAVGLGFISAKEGFRFRVGVGYRNEDYNDPADLAKPSVGNVGWDIGVKFTKKWDVVTVTNDFNTIGSATDNFHWKDKLSVTFGKKDSKFYFGPSVEWDFLSRQTKSTRKLDTKYQTEGGLKF